MAGPAGAPWHAPPVQLSTSGTGLRYGVSNALAAYGAAADVVNVSLGVEVVTAHAGVTNLLLRCNIQLQDLAIDIAIA